MRTEWSEKEIVEGSNFKWSLMSDTDRATMTRTVREMCDSIPGDTLNFLEIGTYNGSTAYGVKAVVEAKGKKLNYYGIDIMTHDTVLFPSATFVLGDSRNVYDQIPNVPFDILFIDGPHTLEHCVSDYENYSPKVKVGGLILFHDTSPASQHGDTNVLVSLKKLSLTDKGYEHVGDYWTEEPYGGISIYRKLR